MNLYLFRHGQTQWALTGQHTGRTDIPLTEEGRNEARALREFAQGMRFSAVFVSPLQRARETAVLAGLEKQITVSDDLAEIDYGKYEGLTTDQIRQQVPDWTVWTHPCPGGETIEQAQARCRQVINTAAGITGDIALVAHGHILRILTATWLALPPSYGKFFMLDTSTVSVLSHEHETPAIKMWNAQIAGLKPALKI